MTEFFNNTATRYKDYSGSFDFYPNYSTLLTDLYTITRRRNIRDNFP